VHDRVHIGTLWRRLRQGGDRQALGHSRPYVDLTSSGSSPYGGSISATAWQT